MFTKPKKKKTTATTTKKNPPQLLWLTENKSNCHHNKFKTAWLGDQHLTELNDFVSLYTAVNISCRHYYLLSTKQNTEGTNIMYMLDMGHPSHDGAAGTRTLAEALQ